MMLKKFISAHLLGHLFYGLIASASDVQPNVSSVAESKAEDVEALSSVLEPDSFQEAPVIDGSDYMRDLRNAMSGKEAMDTERVYTVQAKLPVGEILVLSTASGCSLLNDPEGDLTGKMEPLEFSFRIADLEDCGVVTEGIISGLQAEIASEWASLGGTNADGEVSSHTTLQEIGMRNSQRSSERKQAGDSKDLSVQDLANAFLAANLEIKLLPTTSEGIFVMHFDINGNTTAQEITQMMANIDGEKLQELNKVIKSVNDKIMNATPEEMAEMEQEFKKFVENSEKLMAKEVEDGKNILEGLSQEALASVECSSLALKDCETISKCGVVTLNGEKTCMVSPKTVFLLMETNCGLQSKAGLLSIVRDLVNVGLMNEGNHQTLRQSFNLAQICNSIVHTYLSANIAETEQHEAKPRFDL